MLQKGCICIKICLVKGAPNYSTDTVFGVSCRSVQVILALWDFPSIAGPKNDRGALQAAGRDFMCTRDLCLFFELDSIISLCA